MTSASPHRVRKNITMSNNGFAPSGEIGKLDCLGITRESRSTAVARDHRMSPPLDANRLVLLWIPHTPRRRSAAAAYSCRRALTSVYPATDPSGGPGTPRGAAGAELLLHDRPPVCRNRCGCSFVTRWATPTRAQTSSAPRTVRRPLRGRSDSSGRGERRGPSERPGSARPPPAHAR